MAAPSGIVWGSIAGTGGKQGRLGIYTKVTNNANGTGSSVSIDVWFWGKYSVYDANNNYYFDNNATEANTQRNDVSINVTVDDSWSTSNQTKIAGSYTYNYDRDINDKVISCAAELSGVERVNATMTVTASYTIPALSSYTITYNANGGSGAPSSQTKYHGKPLTLSTTTPTRTGYTFKGWATSSNVTTATYSAGGSYTTNAAVTLYAVWSINTFTVNYDANGGSGAPSSQTKKYGVALTLSTVTPSRSDYNFLGWATSSNATTATYSAGGSYTTNAAVTLYAVWQVAYTKPRISNVSVYRCDADGTVNDTGTYFRALFDWETDKPVTGILVEWSSNTGDPYKYTINGNLYSGSIDTEAQGGGAIPTESSSVISILVCDGSIDPIDMKSSTNINRTLSGTAFLIDFLNGSKGKGIAIGKPAETADRFDVNMEMYLRQGLKVNDVDVTGKNLMFASTNPIVDVTSDTIPFWDKYSGVTCHYFNPSGIVIGKPTNYGLLLSLNNGSGNIHQMWFSQPNGRIYHRGGNSNGWDGDGAWREFLELNDGSFNNEIKFNKPATFSDDATFNDVVSFNGKVTTTAFTNLKNTVNTVSMMRLHNNMLMFYASVDDAINNTNRKGYIGFGSADDTNHFYFYNDDYTNGKNISNLTWTTYSDKRLKKDINDIPSEFVNIWKELEPKIFKWDGQNGENGKNHFGLVAQDVVEIFEKHGLDYRDYGFVVTCTKPDDDTEYFAITYDYYHMLTSLVLKETISQLDDLKAQVEELKKLVIG